MLEDTEFCQMTKSVSSRSVSSFSLKVMLKDQKVTMPLKVRVNENGLLQKIV